MKPNNIAMTQETFDRLPALVPRSVFLAWSGLDRRDLAAEVQAKRMKVYKRLARHGHKSATNLYYKHYLAKLCGFHVNGFKLKG